MIFDAYNPFKNPRPFGLVQPPDSPHCLSCTNSSSEPYHSGTIPQTYTPSPCVEDGLTYHGKPTSVNDCSAIFQAVLSKPGVAEQLCKYFQSLLQAAFLYADAQFGRHTVRSWKWQCLDQVANTVLYGAHPCMPASFGKVRCSRSIRHLRQSRCSYPQGTRSQRRDTLSR